MLYGEDHAFWLTAPPGWMLDNSSGVPQGLHAVFYPRGSSWQNSPSVMYANGVHKDMDAHETFEQFIADDSLHFLERDSTMHIARAPDLSTKEGKLVIVRKFFYSQYEAVAYIDEPKVVVLIVLTTRSQADFQHAYSAFEQLVRSYWFMTDDVNFPPND